MPADISYDLFLEGRLPLRGRLTQEPLRVGERLFQDRWVIAQIVPNPDPPPDFEVYAHRTRRSYAVNDVSTNDTIGSHSSDEQLNVGDVIAIGLKKWRIRAVRQINSELLDGVLLVEAQEQ